MCHNQDCIHRKDFHGHFKTVMDDAFPDGLTEEKWEKLLDEDEQHHFHSYPTSFLLSMSSLPQTPNAWNLNGY